MKNLQSTIEGTWVELKHIQLTEEQKILMVSNKDSDKEAKIALIAKIKAESEVTPDELSLALVIANYNYLKPFILENETYDFISCNMVLTNKISGILNCRVNGEHKQIRF